MGNIKNIDLIKHLLTEDQLQEFETGATMHLRNSRIEFKILEVKGDEITVRVTQGESPGENQLSKKELVNRTKDLFNHFLPDKITHVRSYAYAVSKVDVVSQSWIQNQMQSKGITEKKISAESGIDKERIHEWIAGKRPMSQEVKAMFWYMLR